MARMIPTTIEIRSWMANASPGPRTWAVPPGSGASRKSRIAVAK